MSASVFTEPQEQRIVELIQECLQRVLTDGATSSTPASPLRSGPTDYADPALKPVVQAVVIEALGDFLARLVFPALEPILSLNQLKDALKSVDLEVKSTEPSRR